MAVRTALPTTDLLVQRSLGEFRRALFASFRIPDDCIDSKRYPLFMAREVMRGAIQEFQSTGG
jgi:hypothetical protein